MPRSAVPKPWRAMMPCWSASSRRIDSVNGSAPTWATWIGSRPTPISLALARIVMRNDGVPT